MIIAFITSSIGYGGAEKIMNFVTNYLVNKGNTVIIININSVPSYVREYEQCFNERIKIITLKTKKKNKHFSRIRQIVDIVREYKVNVMVAFTMFPNFYAKIASWFTGIPSIMSERGDPSVTFSKTLKDAIVYFVINKSDGGVFQTKEASNFYTKGLQNRATIIPNPIFLPDISMLSFKPIKEREKSIVSVGRFQNIQKRYDIMLKAFELFSRNHPDYILKLYGSGDDEKQIMNWINELNLSEKVKLMGVVKTPITKICNDGIFIITSDYEGIPNALLEAMAIGLPVVATDCNPGGAKMLIESGVNGQIVPKGDYNSIADALDRYANDYDFADFCGNNAKDVLCKYSPSIIGEHWNLYIEQVVNKKRK